MVTCDINQMFESLPTSSTNPTIQAIYENYIRDPDFSSTCSEDNDCYNIWTGTVASDPQEITLGSSQYNSVAADVSFNPDQWDPAWATGNSPLITARITNIDGHGIGEITDAVVQTIRLNGTVAPTSYQGESDGYYIQFDRALAVLSLGSIRPGLSVPATVQGKIGSDVFSGTQDINIIVDPATLIVKADLHTVGAGSNPGTKKEPIVGMHTRVFDKSTGSCAFGYGISWQNYQDIYNNCRKADEVITDSNGNAVFVINPGNYLVIGYYDNGTKDIEDDDIYIGNSVGEVSANSSKDNKYLQVINKVDNKKVPAKYRKFTGSDLLVIEPEYVEWSAESELYPFVFDSVGDWTVTTAVTPPEGFVVDKEALSAEVNSDIEAVQFTITDIGSKWVGTKVKHKIKHKKQKEITVESEVGIKLTPELAAKKGLGIYGEEDPKRKKKKTRRKDRNRWNDPCTSPVRVL